MNKYILFYCFFVSGCFATSSQMIGPDGKLMWHIECKNTIANCFEEASEVCDNGAYQIIASDSKTSGAIMTNNSVFVVNQRELFIRCTKKSK